MNELNDKQIKELDGEEKIIESITIHKTIKNFDPPSNSAGTVGNTQFQKLLKIKIKAKVMLTYNIDTSDGLTNGARGEILAICEDKKGHIHQLITKFDLEYVGAKKRYENLRICKKYPGGTPIEKKYFPFSISRSQSTVVNTANVIQFPIKLAFACTARKMQGATIQKPLEVIINMTDIFMAAMI